jgi:hypothetical protein
MPFPANIGHAAKAGAPRQEAVMGQAVSRQQPAVVLRSQFNQLRALLAVLAIAVAGLTVAVVILANDKDEVSTSSSTSTAPPVGTTRADGGPEEGTRGIVPARQPNADASPGTRSDGGPEEGTRGIFRRSAPSTFDPNSIKEAPGVRLDGGPEEGTRGIVPPPDPATGAHGGTSGSAGSEYGTSQYRISP